ncbi:MAG: YdcH family protein, partial [Pseudomonadota bacterium]
MNSFGSFSMKSEEVLRVELAEFRRQHADLDAAIRALEEQSTADTFTIKRLKQQKLRL